jgi:hypothetical protein
VTSAVLDEL